MSRRDPMYFAIRKHLLEEHGVPTLAGLELDQLFFEHKIAHHPLVSSADHSHGNEHEHLMILGDVFPPKVCWCNHLEAMHDSAEVEIEELPAHIEPCDVCGCYNFEEQLPIENMPEEATT